MKNQLHRAPVKAVHDRTSPKMEIQEEKPNAIVKINHNPSASEDFQLQRWIKQENTSPGKSLIDNVWNTVSMSIKLDPEVARIDEKPPILGQNEANGLHTCSLCSLVVKSRPILLSHMRQHAFTSYKCPYCPKKFISEAYLQKHYDFSHKHVCQNCSKVFETDIELYKHNSSHLMLKSMHTCSICRLSFVEKSLLDKHQNLWRKFWCCVCERRFATRSYLKKHSLNHALIRKRFYNCEKCGVNLRTKFSFITHWKTHFKFKRSEFCFPKLHLRTGYIGSMTVNLWDNYDVKIPKGRRKRRQRSLIRRRNLIPYFLCEKCGLSHTNAGHKCQVSVRHRDDLVVRLEREASDVRILAERIKDGNGQNQQSLQVIQTIERLLEAVRDVVEALQK